MWWRRKLLPHAVTHTPNSKTWPNHTPKKIVITRWLQTSIVSNAGFGDVDGSTFSVAEFSANRLISSTIGGDADDGSSAATAALCSVLSAYGDAPKSIRIQQHTHTHAHIWHWSSDDSHHTLTITIFSDNAETTVIAIERRARYRWHNATKERRFASNEAQRWSE